MSKYSLKLLMEADMDDDATFSIGKASYDLVLTPLTKSVKEIIDIINNPKNYKGSFIKDPAFLKQAKENYFGIGIPPTVKSSMEISFSTLNKEEELSPEKAKTIYDDNQLANYLGLSPDACISIKGKHPTNWCVARSDASQNAYYGYRTKDAEPTFYFVKNKKKIEEEGPNPIHTKYKPLS